MDIRITIHDNKTFQALLNWLEKFNVEVDMKKTPRHRKSKFKSAKEFQSLSGLWKNKEISQDDLRQKAWPQRKS